MTTSSIISPSSLPYVANTAAVIGLIPTAIGICAILRPQLGLSILQFPTPTAPKVRTLVHGLIRIYGARDLAIGLTTLAIWHFGGAGQGNEVGCMILGCSTLAGVLLVAVDGWMSKVVIGRGEWNHWGGIPIGLGLGLLLCGLV